MAQSTGTSTASPGGTADAAVAAAVAHHRAGRSAEAERICREILGRNPTHAPALHLYGRIAMAARNPKAALELHRRAVTADPRNALYHAMLGDVHLSLGEIEQAEACYRRA